MALSVFLCFSVWGCLMLFLELSLPVNYPTTLDFCPVFCPSGKRAWVSIISFMKANIKNFLQPPILFPCWDWAKILSLVFLYHYPVCSSIIALTTWYLLLIVYISLKFIYWNSNHHCDGTWRYLWEGIRT